MSPQQFLTERTPQIADITPPHPTWDLLATLFTGTDPHPVSTVLWKSVRFFHDKCIFNKIETKEEKSGKWFGDFRELKPKIFPGGAYPCKPPKSFAPSALV